MSSSSLLPPPLMVNIKRKTTTVLIVVDDTDVATKENNMAQAGFLCAILGDKHRRRSLLKGCVVDHQSTLVIRVVVRSGHKEYFLNHHHHNHNHNNNNNHHHNRMDTVARGAVVASSSKIRTSSSSAAADVLELQSSIGFNHEDSDPQPGLEENSKFQCEENVQFWRDFQKNGLTSARENAISIARVSTKFSALGPDGWKYFMKHVGRSTYFAANAVLGVVGSNLHERNKNKDANKKQGGGSFLKNLGSDTVSRMLLESFLSYEQDYDQIRAGHYNQPWDMEFNHRQSSPLYAARQTSRFVSEAVDTMERRHRASPEDKVAVIADDDDQSSTYPDYYHTAFHYQTNGWLSKKSADAYETSTETLFIGRQDAMQRMSLKPLVDLSKKIVPTGKPMKVLEVACGTGRFMTFVRDNLPLQTEYTGIDLSPFYLDAARDHDEYWREKKKQQQRPNINNILNNKRNVVVPKPARLIQAQAENLPFEDESFDAIVCVYLFHELPREIREKAVAEMSRVLTSNGNGIVVFTDSVQRGDRPIFDDAMDNFEYMNEPFYKDYIRDDLPKHFENAGLSPLTKSVRSSTKSLVFAKK